MERYSRVEKPKLGSPINENEIRITSVGLIRNYISYAITLLHEKGAKEIVLKAMGQAISKTVTISEILKSKVPGLHQDVNISSMSITDVFEPIEEGLLPVEVIRHVSMISITLSLSELNQDSPGYQAPAQIDQSKPLYQPNQARLPYNAYREGDVAGEEVDMETTKGVIKGSTTKGTIKKIIKKMMAGIQTGAGVVVLDGAMAIVVLDMVVAEIVVMVVAEIVGMVVVEMAGMVVAEPVMVVADMADTVEAETMHTVEAETMHTVEAKTRDMVEAETRDTVEAETSPTVEAKNRDTVEEEKRDLEEEEVGFEVVEVTGLLEVEMMDMVEAEVDMVDTKTKVMDMEEEAKATCIREVEADMVEAEAMVVDVEGWVMMVVQEVVLVTRSKPKLFLIHSLS
uniref:DNA/RNA-binding protein Alba-like domain-containing protein n=1 Tax=Brassica campestris TaxID=3711 RepID=A0A3P6A1S7_BRACM|nr:unnamed protein product [Brassica rapa]